MSCGPILLEREGLVAALTRQAAALRARHKLEVHTEFCEEPALSFEAKEALYRIAQESLNNTVRHAQAERVEIRLSVNQGEIVLELMDDGVGFDPQAEYSGHMGLELDARAGCSDKGRPGDRERGGAGSSSQGAHTCAVTAS